MRPLLALLLAAAPSMVPAQDAAATPAGSPLASMLPLVLIFIVFYFLLIKPQQKRFKEHQQLLGALKKGDQVVTSGGLVGKIVEADKDGLTTIEIAPGVNVQVTKISVASLASSVKPATTAKKTKGDANVKNDNVTLKKDQIANDN